MGVIGPLLGIGATALGIHATSQKSKADTEYYQSLAEQNEKQAVQVEETAREQVSLIFDTAARQEAAVRENLFSTVASQRAAFAGGNLSVSSKTAEDIARSTANVEAKDEAAIRYNADLSAFQVKKTAAQEKANLLEKAKALKKAGEETKKGREIETGITLLGGIAKLFS